METSITSNFSNDFLNTIMGEWVILNLSDDDCSEIETASTNKDETSAKSLSTDDVNDLEKVVHYHYECGTCFEKVLDYCLPKHHYLEHPDVPFSMQMYMPIEAEKRIQCILCNVEILTSDFDSHQTVCQVENWLSLVNNEFNESSESSSEDDSTQSGHQTPTAIVSRIFQCEACGALVFEENLDEHHENIHPDILLNINIFELYEVTKQEQCFICDQWVENIDKHRLYCHKEKERVQTNEAVAGFRNVCMTEQEFERLRYRIDEVDGQFFLRDSE